VLWIATFLPDQHEVDALFESATRVVGRHRFALGVEDRVGPEVLSVFVETTDDPDIATMQATELYRAIRLDAGLADRPGRLIGIHPSQPDATGVTTDEFLDTARVMLNEGRYGSAVVAAQTACETELAGALRAWLKAKANGRSSFLLAYGRCL
jgi:hypothetical protein